MQRKPLTKFNIHLWLKTLQKAGIEETYVNPRKAIHDKSTANIILSGEKLKAFPLVRKKIMVPTLTTTIQHSFGSFSHSNQKEKEIKWIQTGKEEVKLSLLADDMILYIENPKDSTRKLLELISEYSKVAGYKINT